MEETRPAGSLDEPHETPPPRRPAPRRRRRLTNMRGTAIVVLTAILTKAAIVALVEPRVYDDRLAALREGNLGSRVVAWTMQPDPVTGVFVDAFRELVMCKPSRGGASDRAAFVRAPGAEDDEGWGLPCVPLTSRLREPS